MRVRVQTTAAAVLVLLSLASCSSGSNVPWEDYAPVVKTRIDAMAKSRDCAGLQTEFDNANDNNQISMDRTGHNNAALMGYIDGLMRAAGCYG